MQILILKNSTTQFIKTTSPDNILSLESGEYNITDELKIELLKLWQEIEEYNLNENKIKLTVING